MRKKCPPSPILFNIVLNIANKIIPPKWDRNNCKKESLRDKLLFLNHLNWIHTIAAPAIQSTHLIITTLHNHYCRFKGISPNYVAVPIYLYPSLLPKLLDYFDVSFCANLKVCDSHISSWKCVCERNREKENFSSSFIS